jgi:hypothetical protein
MARGSCAPTATAAHTPVVPTRLQLRQAPVQAEVQQTPSVQKALAHWSLDEHG